MSESVAILAREFQQNPQLAVERAEIEYLAPGGKDFWQQIHAFRPEFYALLSVVSAGAVSRAVQAPLDIAGFADLTKEMISKLNTSVIEEVDQLYTDGSPLYTRLYDVCNLFRDTYEGFRYESLPTLLRSGAGTAAHETSNSLAAISRVVRDANPSATSAEIAAVARRSRGLILKFAGVNIDQLVPVTSLVSGAQREVIDPEFIPETEALRLRAKADGTRYVDFEQPIANLPRPGHKSLIGETYTRFRTLGCPARIKVTDESPVAAIWNWAIDALDTKNLFLDTEEL